MFFSKGNPYWQSIKNIQIKQQTADEIPGYNKIACFQAMVKTIKL